MTLVEHGFNPRALGYHFGYDEPRVIRRIDELAELKNGWHFGAGIAPSSSVLAVAKVVASYAVSRRLPDIDAFPGKSGEVTIAIYLGEEDHSFQVRQNLSFRYWSESNPDSEVEEGLSFRDVIQKIDVIARAQPSWNLFSSFIFDIGTVISGTLEARLSKTPAMEVEYPSSISIAYGVANMAASVNMPAGFIQPSALNPRFSGNLTNQSCLPDTD